MPILTATASFNGATNLWTYSYTLTNPSGASRISQFVIRGDGALAVRWPSPPYLGDVDLSTPYTTPSGWHFHIGTVGYNSPLGWAPSGLQFAINWGSGSPYYTQASELAAGATASGFSFTSASGPDSFRAFGVYSHQAQAFVESGSALVYS